MKFFESKIIDLRRAAPAKPGKRFVSCFIDMILCGLIALLFFQGGSAIAFQSKSYTDAGKIIDEEIKYYIDWTEESHVVEYLDKENGVRKDTEVMVYENLLRAIYHSYSVLGNAQQPDFTLDGYDSVIKFGESSLENDTVAYFYTNYGPKNGLTTLEGKTESLYLFELYQETFKLNSSMFVFNLEVSEVPVLTTQAAYSILYYFINNSDDTIGQQGLDYYNAFYDSYGYLLLNAENIMIRSEPYYSEHYTLYYDALSVQARITNITLIISIFISYLITVLLPKFLFKDERSLGRVIMKLGTVDEEKDPISIISIILKSVIEIIGFMFIAFIIYMFPPFNGVYDAMMTPFIGEYNLTIILLVIAIIALLINAFSLFTHYRQNLIDMIFHHQVVDLHYLDLGDIDDESEGKSI